jgi:hypothetical protein
MQFLFRWQQSRYQYPKPLGTFKCYSKALCCAAMGLLMVGSSDSGAVNYTVEGPDVNHYPIASINRFDKYAGQLFQESVEPYKGQLSLGVRPISVPGPGGMDMVIGDAPRLN